MENCEKSYIELIDEKIELGRSLVEKLQRDFIEIEGALKTKRNIDKEIKFLEKVCKHSVKAAAFADEALCHFSSKVNLSPMHTTMSMSIGSFSVPT